MKKSGLIGLSLVIFLAGAIFIVTNSFVSAQNAGQGLEVSPPSQEVTIDPGKTITIKAKLRNRGNTMLPIQVHIEDFTAKGDEGQIQLSTNSPYSIASWTTVSPSTFKLGPGEDKEVTATIKAPTDAAGGRFGSFIFAVQNNDTNNNTAAVSQQIASLFLVRVSGKANEKLTIKDFSAPSYSEFGPVPFSIKVNNTGNVHSKTYGLINVTDMFGRKVADIVVPGVNIFPQADRVVQSKLDKQFLIGRYTATALLYYGTDQVENLSSNTTFFVFPTRIAVGVFIILFILYLLRKRLKKAVKALFDK